MCVKMTPSPEVLVCLLLKGRTGTCTSKVRDSLGEKGITFFLQLELVLKYLISSYFKIIFHKSHAF